MNVSSCIWCKLWFNAFWIFPCRLLEMWCDSRWHVQHLLFWQRGWESSRLCWPLVWYFAPWAGFIMESLCWSLKWWVSRRDQLLTDRRSRAQNSQLEQWWSETVAEVDRHDLTLQYKHPAVCLLDKWIRE